jgi:hypothetical protein
MHRLLDELGFLSERGIRINFNRDVQFLLAGYNKTKDCIYLGPNEEHGIISVCFTPGIINQGMRCINSTGYQLTQIFFSEKMFNVCHTRNILNRHIHDSFSIIPATDYLKKVKDESDIFALYQGLNSNV